MHEIVRGHSRSKDLHAGLSGFGFREIFFDHVQHFRPAVLRNDDALVLHFNTASRIMFGPSATVVDPVHDRGAEDRYGSAERRPSGNVRQPVCAQIDPAQDHHHNECSGEHLEIPALRAGPDQDDDRSESDRRPGNGMTRRKGPARRIDERQRGPDPHVRILHRSDKDLGNCHR